jgi:pyruvate,water dikinase
MLRRMWESYPRMLGAVRSPTAIVSGSPASAGRATGPVRVIRGPAEFEELRDGEILVAPLTAPAWTPLFQRAAGVVTDVGSPAAHASIIAREFGIPAVVGCGDATARLRTGMRVTVDGGLGNVEPA